RIPPETLQGLKDLGLYGLQVPEEYGGLGLNATEYSRLVEVLALDGSIAVTLAAHQTIGFKGILLNGSEAQKQKYLPRLATGEWTAAFCLTETNSGSDAASIQTTAELTDDQKGFRLNGTKIWISNGGIADLMTVFARTSNPARPKTEITAFIVERNFGGVSNGQPEDKMGIRGSNTAQVYFDNTFVPMENVLGEVGGGFKVAMNILNSGRFSMGSGCAGVLKELLKSSVEHAVTRSQFGHTLADFGLIKEKMARIAVNTYAMESMTYLTAGLIDSYENQDCSVEAAIVKIFSSEKIWEHTSDCLQVLGGSGYMRDYPYERILRDSRISQIFEGTNEILRLFIALSGLQHAGVELSSLVKKLRNPLMHPDFAVRTLMKRIRQRKDKPKLDMGLHEFVHPSLRESTDRLEYCTIKFALATEQFLGREGKNVTHPSNQYNVKRMADIAIDIYAMTAVLGRASRSYCIGVRNCDQEVRGSWAATISVLTSMNFTRL
ncbi:UNVERIFIED_CONTAM: hypothetical protein GTU68_037315, partial [Idotea baltica]|nr:hypothetical protein [Idotea baltica]